MRTLTARILPVLALLFAPLASATVTGCSDDGAESASDNLTQSIDIESLDVTKEHAPAGLTVLKNKADYVEFFGSDPPESVNFQKHWVVHVSMGMKNSGGFSTTIVKIDKTGKTGKKTLVVHTKDVSPGTHCNVTQAITNPQMTVRIKKQSGTPKAKLDSEPEVMQCGQQKMCGGFAGLSCGENEYCELNHCGIADESGVCKAKPQACAEILKPVCGCDGETYDNKCSAHSAGVAVSSEGECTALPGGGEGDVCGTSDSPDCQAGLKCCYPCGIQGCDKTCVQPCEEGSPGCLDGCVMHP